MRYHKPRGNNRTEVVTAFGVDGVINAVNVINNRTKWKNAQTSDARRYDAQRRKITLPSAVDVWLKKEV